MKLAVTKKEISVLGKQVTLPWQVKGAKFEASIPWALATILPIIALAFIFPPALYVLITLGIVITTHEAGHFFVAKLSGMKPAEFFWGFGPEVFAIQTKNSRYGLKFISAGGYVKLEGMTSQSELPEGFDEEDSFRGASAFGRLMTILAGPFVNFFVALAAFTASALLQGAALGQAVNHAFTQFWTLITLTLGQFWTLIQNPVGYLDDVVNNPEEVEVAFAGPKTLAAISEQAFNSGLNSSLVWLAIVSAAVGLVNLLPFPPLDGSHAVAAVFDGVTRLVTRNKNYMFNIHKLTPLAYVTIIFLGFLTVTAAIVDFQTPTADFFSAAAATAAETSG